MLRRNGKRPGNREFSPVRGKGLWWEGCVDKQVLNRERKSDGVMRGKFMKN